MIKDLNQILTYSNGPQPISEPVMLEEVWQSVAEELASLLDEENGQMIVDFTLAGEVKAVPAYVRSIFFHLVTNAIKFRSDASPVIHLTSVRSGEQVVVSICDNGLGVDTERHQGKLFTLYQRFHTHREGRGLGLYLVKTQMEALGGHIEIESRVGQGTTFRLYFEAPVSAHAAPLNAESSPVH